MFPIQKMLCRMRTCANQKFAAQAAALGAAPRKEALGKGRKAVELQEQYMLRALELADRGLGRTAPNPLVGCVIVKAGRIIGEGWHEQLGGLHAERNALASCRESPAGAQMYVTLEPCCHYGRTPPCTEAILEAGIREVYIGCMDPNPLVGGKGAAILREHGVRVTENVCGEECRKANEVFFHYIQNRTPFVAMKFAMTLDGKIAAYTGDSRWVTGEEARRDAHELRKRYAGILVGIGTVLADDPMLNCRIEEGVDPVRIVCDSRLRLPLKSRLVQTARQIPVIAAGVRSKDPGYIRRREALRAAGVDVAEFEEEEEVPLGRLMEALGKREIDSVLLEGGGRLNESALREGIVRKVYAYIAPKIVGGGTAPTPVGGEGAARMAQARQLADLSVSRLGDDIRMTGYICRDQLRRTE